MCWLKESEVGGSTLSCLFPPIVIIIMYFLCFLGSRDFRVLVRSQNFKLRCFTLLGVALICFSRHLPSCLELNCCSARLVLYSNKYRLRIPLLTRCTIKVENALFKWKLRMLLISENWSRAQPIKSFPSTLRFQLETVLSFHQLERADYWVKTTCLARINHRLQICIYVEFLAVITY